MKEGLSFDDVLIQPQFSDVLPNEVSLNSCDYKFRNMKIPLLSAAMDTITEENMMYSMNSNGGLGVLHKNGNRIETITKYITKCRNSSLANVMTPLNHDYIACAIGVNDSLDFIKEIIDLGVTHLFIDSAHAHTKNIGEFILNVKYLSSDVVLIAGNVSTYDGALYLMKLGVDGVKIGQGGGSICTTRIVTGCGVPQITALLNASRAKEECDYNGIIISDGGIKNSGDIIKSLVCGADYVMLGSLLSGSPESPGDIIEENGEKYKTYRGMGSTEAMNGGSDRYQRDASSSKSAPEGVSTKVKLKMPIDSIISDLIGGVKSGMGYLGCRNISELKELKDQLIKISSGGLNESKPHIYATK